MKNNKTVAIVPGSFDPITYGHVDITKRAAQLYDKVYVAVMINDQKKYMLTIEEREAVARLALEDINNVEVISSTGMLWQLAKELGADAIVKGYRNKTDYDYEIKMAEFNAKYCPEAKTVLLRSDDKLEALSSTMVRERIQNNDPLDGLLPPKALEELKVILNKFS